MWQYIGTVNKRFNQTLCSECLYDKYNFESYQNLVHERRDELISQLQDNQLKFGQYLDNIRSNSRDLNSQTIAKIIESLSFLPKYPGAIQDLESKGVETLDQCLQLEELIDQVKSGEEKDIAEFEAQTNSYSHMIAQRKEIATLMRNKKQSEQKQMRARRQSFSLQK